MYDPRFVVRTDEKFKQKVQIKAIKERKTVSKVILDLLKSWLKKS